MPVDLVRFYSSLLKGHVAGRSTPALPRALWTSGDSLDKLKAEQRLELWPSGSKCIRSQNAHAECFLGLASNKRFGSRRAADVLLAWGGYQDIFRKVGTPSCRKTDLFRG